MHFCSGSTESHKEIREIPVLYIREEDDDVDATRFPFCWFLKGHNNQPDMRLLVLLGRA